MTDEYVALVNPLCPHRAVCLGCAVVEVDQHHPVGDDALAADLNVLEGRDSALLAHYGLGTDQHFAFVCADLAAGADPAPAAEVDLGVLPDLKGDAVVDEGDSVGDEASAPAEVEPKEANQQPRVLEADHVVGEHELHQRDRPAVKWGRGHQVPGRLSAEGLGQSLRFSGCRFHPVKVRRRGWRVADAAAAAPAGMIQRPMARPNTPDELADELLAGDRRALARAISWVEDDDPRGWELVKKVYPHTGKGRIVGLTGAPGAGKSTLVGALTRAERDRGSNVGVLSIDPSSPFTHGALLGDRIRLTEHFLDPGVFIRSMANRGALGGLSEGALQAALLIDAAGKDVVMLETVGVGQAEVDIINHSDTIVLVLMPGSGDSIQALKAGVMEIPDIIVVNKADHPMTDTMVREVRSVLALGHQEGWVPPIIKTEAVHAKGIDELLEKLDEHHAFITEEGTLVERRRRNLRAEVLSIATGRIRRELEAKIDADPKFAELVELVAERKLDPASAATQILEGL